MKRKPNCQINSSIVFILTNTHFPLCKKMQLWKRNLSKFSIKNLDFCRRKIKNKHFWLLQKVFQAKDVQLITNYKLMLIIICPVPPESLFISQCLFIFKRSAFHGFFRFCLPPFIFKIQHHFAHLQTKRFKCVFR
jgi:hypothetical protein